MTAPGWTRRHPACSFIGAELGRASRAEASWSRPRKRRHPTRCIKLSSLAGNRRSRPQRARGALCEGDGAAASSSPDQIFNRVHVEDIATAPIRGFQLRRTTLRAPFTTWTDDAPSPPQDVVAFAAGLLGVEPPPEVSFEAAKLSPMAASFYAENKRVRNDLIKRRLGFAPAFPSYREGLRELLGQGE